MANLSMVSIKSNDWPLFTTAHDNSYGPSGTSVDFLDKEIIESIHVLILSLCEAPMGKCFWESVFLEGSPFPRVLILILALANSLTQQRFCETQWVRGMGTCPQKLGLFCTFHCSSSILRKLSKGKI